MPNPVIIFDLDGTLADTAPDLLATLNRIIEPHGLEPVSVKEIGHLVGQGAREMISRTFLDNGERLSQEALEELFNSFLIDYSANIAVHTKLFDGALPAIEELQKEGFIFAVCTNKTESLARQLLKELSVDDHFAAITGRNTFPFCKPDGRHVLETITMASGNKQQSIMIGDSITDTTAAKNAGIPSVAVSFGYSSQPVFELGADKVISHFDQLPAAVQDISNKNF